MAITNVLKKVSLFLGFSTKDTKRLDYANEMSIDERRQLFKINESYYNNNVYDRLNDGGALDLINEFLGELRSNEIKGIYNSVKRVVDVHAHSVFAGAYGQEIKIAETTSDNRLVHPAVFPAMTKIANWSNFDQELERYVRYGALFGTVGIRIIAKVGKGFPDDDPKERRVYLEFEHPSTIINAIRDKRGNVKSIITEYVVNTGDLKLDNRGESVKQRTVRELMTQKVVERVTENRTGGFSVIPFNVGGEEHKKLTNQLGVTPYVIVHHEPKSGLFGSWCFQGVERKLDVTNALSAHLDKQIVRHVKAAWVVAASGEPPENIKLSGQDIIWFRLDEGVSAPTIQPMVANLSLSDVQAKITNNLDEIADSLPELKATDGKYLSGQSGETVAQLRLPAEVRVLAARKRYEDGLIRASKIAMSWGILLGIFDFETGTGTREAADQAYGEGRLDHRYEVRDALPLTVLEKLETQIKRNEAGISDEILEDILEEEEPTPDDAVETGDVITEGIEEGE